MERGAAPAVEPDPAPEPPPHPQVRSAALGPEPAAPGLGTNRAGGGGGPLALRAPAPRLWAGSARGGDRDWDRVWGRAGCRLPVTGTLRLPLPPPPARDGYIKRGAAVEGPAGGRQARPGVGSAERPPCQAAWPFTAASEPGAVAAGNRPVREASGWEGPGKGGGEAGGGGERACEERAGATKVGTRLAGRRGGAGCGWGGPGRGVSGGSRSPFSSPPQ